MTIGHVLLVGVVATISSYLLVGRLISYASRVALDVPNDRSSHTRPTPRGGGAAIAVVTTLGLTVICWSTGVLTRQIIISLAAAMTVAGVGFVDDLRSLSASTRLLIHALAASAVLYICGYPQTLALPFVGTIELGPLGWLVCCIWVVGLTNIYNFMDGIDGIAGGQAVVAGAAWVCLGMVAGQSVVACLGVLLAGTSLGFLIHNWSPARIFMGDVGSTFIGFTLAIMPLMFAEAQRSALAVSAVLVVLPFVLDGGLTLARRLARGVPVWQAHREHLYQKLVQSGRSHGWVATVYVAAAAVSASVATIWAAMHIAP